MSAHLSKELSILKLAAYQLPEARLQLPLLMLSMAFCLNLQIPSVQEKFTFLI